MLRIRCLSTTASAAGTVNLIMIHLFYLTAVASTAISQRIRIANTMFVIYCATLEHAHPVISMWGSFVTVERRPNEHRAISASEQNSPASSSAKSNSTAENTRASSLAMRENVILAF